MVRCVLCGNKKENCLCIETVIKEKEAKNKKNKMISNKSKNVTTKGV